MGDPKKKAPWLERAAATLGAAIALCLIGILGWEAMQAPGRPPSVSVAVERITPTEGGYIVGVRAQNRSSTTAAGVVIEAELGGERGEATLDYVPGRSSRTAGFFFEQDPRRGELSVRALGYTTP
jgi:uncharacterized protein (TIGR02588 family)